MATWLSKPIILVHIAGTQFIDCGPSADTYNVSAPPHPCWSMDSWPVILEVGHSQHNSDTDMEVFFTGMSVSDITVLLLFWIA